MLVIAFEQPYLFARSDGGSVDDRIRWIDKVVYFYKAPIVRFYYNVVTRDANHRETGDGMSR